MIAPGIHDMTSDSYHALATPTPALSSSIARILLASSPLHAWYAHPALNPAGVREEREAYDIGTAAHALLLEGSAARVVIVDAKDWRGKAAQEQRDAAYTEGKLPLLAAKWLDVQSMVAAARGQLAAHERPTPLTAGQAEQTLVWQEGDVWCKARLDWLHEGARYVDDYKTTSASANPETWCRNVFPSGVAIQAAFYLRGVRTLLGYDAAFRFVVQETYPPYALSVVGLGPDALVLAEKKVIFALDLWRDCLARGEWPGYPTRTAYADLPPWEEASWIARELRAEGIRDDGRPIEPLLVEGTP
jgi:hypothetical protein